MTHLAEHIGYTLEKLVEDIVEEALEKNNTEVMPQSVKELKLLLVKVMLRKTGYNKSRAATLLGMSRGQIQYLTKREEISK